MSKLKDLCKNCTHYSAYYKEWARGLGKLDNGYCVKQKKAMQQNETCEEYKSNEEKEKKREKIQLEFLEQASIALIEIATSLKEKNK